MCQGEQTKQLAGEYVPWCGEKIGIAHALLETNAPIQQSTTKFIYADNLRWTDNGKLTDGSVALARKMFTSFEISDTEQVIVRAGISGGKHWTIDVLPTFRDQKDADGVVSAIEYIQKHYEKNAENFDALAHDWNAEFDPNHHVPYFMIQKQVAPPYAGSVLRHPHGPKKIVQYVDKSKCHGYARTLL